MVYNTFAVAGAGGLGAFIVKHLAAAPNTTVTVLSRSQNVPVPSGVHVKVSLLVDSISAASLTSHSHRSSTMTLRTASLKLFPAWTS